MRRNQNFYEKVTYSFRLFELPFFPLLFLFAAAIGLGPGLLGAQKNVQERVIEAINFYHGAARCGGRKFCFEFFAHPF